MKKRLFVILTAVFSALCITFTACGGNPSAGENAGVTAVELNKTSLTLEVGSEERLTAKVLPDSATDKTVEWSSSQESVCTVSDGKVTAVAQGRATVTATAGGKTASCEVSVYLTLGQLVADYNDRAESFVMDSVRPSAVENREVLSESCWISANAEYKIDKVTFVYIYKVDETARALETATATLQSPVNIADVAEGKDVQAQVNVERTTVFEFDAKENFDKQETVKAIYTAGKSDSSPVKVIKETKTVDTNYREFHFPVQTDVGVTVRGVTVEAGNGSEQALIENLQDKYSRTFTTMEEYSVDGLNVYATPYEFENTGTENPDTDPNPDPEEPTVSNSEIKALLDEKCVDGILERCFLTFTADKANISNSVWYLTKDADGNITCAEYSFNYRRSSTSEYFYIAKVEFDTPITVQDIKDGKLSKATYSSAYWVNYNVPIQETRAALKNAICDKLFGENQTATRYIVDNGAHLDMTLNASREFKVVEVSEEGAKEISVRIKNSSNDAGFISNLNIETNYRTFGGKAYTISGTKLVEEN